MKFDTTTPTELPDLTITLTGEEQRAVLTELGVGYLRDDCLLSELRAELRRWVHG